MKKLLILPAVILTMLVCFIPITASADEVTAYYGDTPNFPQYTLSYCLDNYDSQSYIYSCYKVTKLYFGVMYDFYYIYYTSFPDTVSYTDENDTIFISNTQLCFTRYVNYIAPSGTSDFSLQGSSSSNNYYEWYIDYGNSTINNPYNCSGDIICFDFCLNGTKIDVNALNVSVEFNPELSGNIDRSETLANGVVTYQDLFNFNVINNSRRNIQWYMAIVEQGYNVNFYSPAGIIDMGERGADLTEYNSSIKYIYLYNEDVYLLKDSAFYMDAHVQSSLHQVAAGSESGLNLVKWDMLDLQRDHNYDVVVYAMFNDADKASFVYGSTLYNMWVAQPAEFDNIQEVYRSTFSVKNPATYNKDSKIGGAVANNSDTDINGLTKELYGYSDYDDTGTPTTIWGNYTYGRDVGPSFSGNYYTPSSSSGRFGQLMSLTNGALGYFTAVLKLFPANCYQVFLLGFTALIIVAIIKKVT